MTAKKQNFSIKDFILMVVQLSGFALVMAGIGGMVAEYFDWDLALKIGGSRIDLLKDYAANGMLIVVGVLLAGMVWVLEQEKVKNFLGKNKKAIWAGIAVLVVVLGFAGKELIVSLEGGPALAAISNGDLDGLKKAMTEHEHTEAEKSKMLFRAIQNSDEIVQYLLDEGVSANSKRDDNVTALTAACTWGTDAMIDALKKAGAEGECNNR